MPIFPLPAGGAGLGGGALPVSSADEILALFPTFVRNSDPAPVRDALIAALLEIHLEYQRRSEYSAAQSNVLRSTDAFLADFGNQRNVIQAQGEDQEAYRARMLVPQDYVTPKAILAAADSLLAPYTHVKSRYAESILDRWYVHDGGAHAWHSFVFANAETATPLYPDRLYADDAAANDGFVVPQREPMGAMAFTGGGGRTFVLRVPDLSPLDNAFSSVFQEPVVPTLRRFGFFIGDGSVGQNGAYIRATSSTALRIYQTIVNVIERIKGHSIRWTLYADPRLVA